MCANKTELVIVVESGRCSWGRCIFCSFSKKPDVPKPDFDRLKKDLDTKLNRQYDTVKYLNSGSFLDELQIPVKFQEYLIKKCIALGVKDLVIECLPTHITKKNLEVIKDASNGKKLKIHFALGLEVADDEVLAKICKGFKLSDYLAAVAFIKKEGFFVRTYLMANLPYIGDISQSLADSVRFAEQHGDSVVIINTFAYGYAPLFSLWLNGEWRPIDRRGFESLVNKHRKNKKVEIYFEDYITYPRFKSQPPLVGATIDNLKNPVYDVWQDYLARFYTKPEIKKYALFLPCSYRKPYSRSQTHHELLKRLTALPFYSNLHQLMISNPGVIPREFETKYPFAHYDWPEWEETLEIKKTYIKVTEKRIETYLSHHKYEQVFAYFKPESESFIALKNACKKLKIPLIYCVDELLCSDIKKDKKNILKARRMLDNLVRCLRINVAVMPVPTITTPG
ncbi:MAG: DUF5591 domain-containing protein [archaeon]